MRKRTFRKLFTLALCVALGSSVYAFGNPYLQPEPAVAAASTDWGLSFQSEGAAPIGNATAAELSAYNAYYVGDTSK